MKANASTYHKPSIDELTARTIVKKLLSASKPVMYVGGGILLADAARELRDLADHLGIPVAHSLMGKGALPDDHPLTLGMTGFWGTKYINDSCRNADYILALGTRFCEADCSSWEGEFTFNMPPTKLIHIDIDPSELGRNYPVEIGVDRRFEAGADGVEPRRARIAAAAPSSMSRCARKSSRIASSSRAAMPPRRRARSFRCGRSAFLPT